MIIVILFINRFGCFRRVISMPRSKTEWIQPIRSCYVQQSIELKFVSWLQLYSNTSLWFASDAAGEEFSLESPDHHLSNQVAWLGFVDWRESFEKILDARSWTRSFEMYMTIWENLNDRQLLGQSIQVKRPFVCNFRKGLVFLNISLGYQYVWLHKYDHL